MKLLEIQSSPRGESSDSIALTKSFIEACKSDNGMPRAAAGAPQPRFVMRWQDPDVNQLPQALLDRIKTGEYHQAAVASCPPENQEGSFTAFRLAVLLF